MSNDDVLEERVRMLAELVGIPIDDADLPEVANRFASLMQELDRLRDLDLEGIEPVAIFPDTGEVNGQCCAPPHGAGNAPAIGQLAQRNRQPRRGIDA